MLKLPLAVSRQLMGEEWTWLEADKSSCEKLVHYLAHHSVPFGCYFEQEGVHVVIVPSEIDLEKVLSDCPSLDFTVA